MCPVLGHLDDMEHRIQALYEQFGGPLLRHVRKTTGNDLQWAEDVVQETMVRACVIPTDCSGSPALSGRGC